MDGAPGPAPVPLRRRIERYAIAHASGYPLAFLWAVASIPVTIHLFARQLDALEDDTKAVGELVVHRVAWPAAVAFALPHLLALRWAFGREPARWAKRTWVAICAVASVGVLFGAGSWLWLFLRS